MTVILDADGVLLDWMQAFELYMRQEHGVEPIVPHHMKSLYDLQEGYPSIPMKTLLGCVDAMSKLPQYFSGIPLFAGVIDGVARLRAEQECEVHCVSLGGSAAICKELRSINLQALNLDSLIMLPHGSSKFETLTSFEEGSIFVDDLESNLLDAQRAGMVPVMMTRSYNENLAWDGLRASTMHEVADLAHEIRAKIQPPKL